MRIWSLHPKYLDTCGLVACWRETLLAQAVICGRTKGYQHHPQLIRFRNCGAPSGAIAEYLRGLHVEATSRDFRFDAKKIGHAHYDGKISVTRGQVEYEWAHLQKKLVNRDRDVFERNQLVKRVAVHPLFKSVSGSVEEWEKTSTS